MSSAVAACGLALVSGCQERSVAHEAQATRPVDAGVVSRPPSFGRLRGPGLDRPIHKTPTGAALDDETPVLLGKPDALEPLPLDKLALDDGAQIQLADGRRWIRFSYSPAKNAPPRPRWLMPAHSRDEIDRRRGLLETEAQRLPKDAPITSTVARRMGILATVSVAEGEFGGAATHRHDTAASLGIFQWAQARSSTTDDGSSLSRFFGDLSRRARAHDGSPGEQTLYEEAWRQSKATGLDLSDGKLRVNGKPATGAELELLLQPEFGRAPLRTYQLVAATDWVERTAAQKLKSGITVGSVLVSDRALSTVVLLGVNRPRYVLEALELAIQKVGASDENRLLWELRRQALELYPKGDRERRAMRLLTSEPLF